MFDEFLLAVDEDKSQRVNAETLPTLGLKEREHLQKWVLAHPEMLGTGVAVVTSEFDKWQAASGEAVADRLDVLGLAPDGRLVVVELKRDLAPHTVHMQAINYGAMVSRLSVRDIAELWVAWHGSEDKPLDVDSVINELETKWLLTADSIKSPRIVLMAGPSTADQAPSCAAGVAAEGCAESLVLPAQPALAYFLSPGGWYREAGRSGPNPASARPRGLADRGRPSLACACRL